MVLFGPLLFLIVSNIVGESESDRLERERQESAELWERVRANNYTLSYAKFFSFSTHDLWYEDSEMDSVILLPPTPVYRGEEFAIAEFMLQIVHSREEAILLHESTEENILAAWPSIHTNRVLFAFNYLIVEGGIDLAEFNLAYPLTLVDVVEQQEAIDEVILTLNRQGNLPSIRILAFYANMLLEDVNEAIWKKINYAGFWDFTVINEMPVDYRVERDVNNNNTLLNFAWHVEEHGAEDSELIFVLNEGEANGFEPHILAAFPINPDRIENQLEVLNEYVIINGIDLSDFSLTYPIILENVVYYWQSVNELLNSFDEESDILTTISNTRSTP